jgi:ATP phosphoribosyltransferase
MAKAAAPRVLRLGLPAGRLKEMTLALLKKAGYPFTLGSRSYVPKSGDPEIEARMFRAQEIPRYVAAGNFDAGITGQDMVRESGRDVHEVATFAYARAGFGTVRWVVAVPKDSPIRTVKDLQGKRIATEGVNLTKAFLASKGVTADVEFSWGATEAKPPELVDAVVETTETGSSLEANNLRVVAEIMVSSTCLIANLSSWKDAWKRAKIEEIAMMLRGALVAEGMVGLKMNVPRKRYRKVLSLLPAMKRPTVSPLAERGWLSIEIVSEEREVRPLIAKLKAAGATGLVEYPLNKVIP